MRRGADKAAHVRPGRRKGGRPGDSPPALPPGAVRIEVKPHYRNIPDEALLEDLRRVARLVGKPTLTLSEYAKHGRYCDVTVRNRFGSWKDALLRIGKSPGVEQNATRDDLLYNILAVWVQLGRQPELKDMRRPVSKFSVQPYVSRFGSWSRALDVFGEWLHWGDPPWYEEARAAQRAEEEAAAARAAEERRRDRRGDRRAKGRKRRQPNLRQRFQVMRRDGFRCRICGRSPASHPGVQLDIDHIVPWSKGGETAIGNLQTLCSDCNQGKAAHHEPRAGRRKKRGRRPGR